MKRNLSIILLLCLTISLFSQEIVLEIEPYTQDNIPSWAKDVRRTSIITLGSVPFTTLASTLGYSLYRYIANDFNPDFFPNPFPGSSSAAKLDTDEQIGIIITAASLSLLIGLTDLIVNKVQDSKVQKLEEEQNEIIILQGEEL